MKNLVVSNYVPKFLILFFCFAITSCKSKEPPPLETPQTFSREQMSAKFYYDLGPASVNVSQYPPHVQENYTVFLAVCSTCHTSARPLNAPYVEQADWKRFVKRMHVKMENIGFTLRPEQEKEIIEFLAYDSKIRKINRKAEFESQSEYLKNLYEQMSKEREKLILEETLKLPKKETPYTGVK